ncbi:ribonuclease P protein subunit p30 [Lingula anatina]|uniref:Ribonuclease P protein subunit p30 n=1 Tax=Lingula anatina TaxID=7574 RepID=A0A1S3I453_LINAN|nr:ribonuclease P protein subunit p30 [Lingula anatina]|eukprot:XP_013393013.1 ribonuclease P protein subunit p30 [Lingula anatina]
MAHPCELNILCDKNSGNNVEDRVKMALSLGYEVIVMNNFIPEFYTKKKKKGQEKTVPVPEASEIKIPEHIWKEFKKRYKNIQQCTRFTTVITDAAQMHGLTKQKELKGYDITAVQPTTEKLFHNCCTSDDVDIITFDMTEKIPFKIKRPSINKALEMGIHFELTYSPAIRDPTLRKHSIRNAIKILTVCKGKNVVLSSGCERAVELRGPSDVANLGILFGLNEAQAKEAVSSRCRAVLLHAEARKTIRGTAVMKVTPVVDISQKLQSSTESQKNSLQTTSELMPDESDKSDCNGLKEDRRTGNVSESSFRKRLHEKDTDFQFEDTVSSVSKKSKTVNVVDS